MIPLAVPNIGDREKGFVMQALQDGWVSTVGPFVDRLEEAVARISGTKSAVAVAAGTMGLHVALHGLGVGRGDLVILPSFTFIGSANAIAHTGARPWLIDITPESWTLDADEVAVALAEDCTTDKDGVLYYRPTGERVAAIMPVYTLGLPADMDRIADLGKAYRLPVVADAAAALGATYKGRPLGSLATATVYSFNGNKTVTTGGGGAITGPGGDFMVRLKHLTTTARVGQNYDHDEVGFNYRMTNIEAAIGCAQLERLQEFLSAKRRIRAAYNAAFKDIPGVAAFPEVDWAENGCWFSGIVAQEAQVSQLLIGHLRKHDIMARPFWKPIHFQAPFRDSPRRSMAYCESLWARILTLPCSTQLTEAEQDKVVAVLLGLLK